MLNIFMCIALQHKLGFHDSNMHCRNKNKKKKVLLKLLSSKNKLFEKVLGFHIDGSIIFAFAKEYLNRSFKVASFLLLV